MVPLFGERQSWTVLDERGAEPAAGTVSPCLRHRGRGVAPPTARDSGGGQKLLVAGNGRSCSERGVEGEKVVEEERPDSFSFAALQRRKRELVDRARR